VSTTSMVNELVSVQGTWFVVPGKMDNIVVQIAMLVVGW
jgi:hypothetical protein